MLNSVDLLKLKCVIHFFINTNKPFTSKKVYKYICETRLPVKGNITPVIITQVIINHFVKKCNSWKEVEIFNNKNRYYVYINKEVVDELGIETIKNKYELNYNEKRGMYNIK